MFISHIFNRIYCFFKYSFEASGGGLMVSGLPKQLDKPRRSSQQAGQQADH